MADLYRRLVPRTAIVWGPNGATGGITVTKDMNLDNLASGSAREGVYGDVFAGASTMPAWCTLEGWIESGTTPATTGAFDIFLAWYYTTFGTGPAATTGTDAAYTAANRFQLGPADAWVTPLASSNTLQKGQRFWLKPKARYVGCVGYNGWSQAVRNQGTDSDNLSRIILTPYDEILTETA